MFKRMTTALMVLLVAALMLTACRAATPESGAGEETPPTREAMVDVEVGAKGDVDLSPDATPEVTTPEIDVGAKKGPKTAKKLTIGIWNTAANITTYSIGNSWNDWVLWLTHDKLREPSPYVGEMENWLAESVELISDDGRTWEIKLRDGIRWHDGTDLTAEDVAFTFIYYREGPANRWTHHCSQVPRVESAEVIDRLTLRVTLVKPAPNWDKVTAADLGIIQKAQWENVEEPRKFMDISIGTGPYKMVDYKPDEYYKFVANEDYFKGKPLVDELMLVMIKDPETMFTALKSGEIDGAARSLPPELLVEWEDAPDIETMNAPSMWGVWADVNMGREPFNTREMRQVLSYAINPDPLLERVMLNKGKSGRHGWPHPDSFWTKPGLEQPYDQAKAIEMLDEMGYKDTDGDGFRETPDGEPIDWDIHIASNQPLYARAAEMLVDQMAEVGLRFHIETLDPASFNALWSNGEYDVRVMEITPHGICDQDMLIILYKVDCKREMDHDPDKEEIVSRWFEQQTREDRLKVSFELQELNNLYPNRITLWYPDGIFAYRWESYDNYQCSPGYGIYHKYSFLPNEARGATVAQVVQ